MTKPKRTLTTAFDQEEVKETSPEVTEATVSSASDEEVQTLALTVEDVKKELLGAYEEKSKKPTVEETHIRSTFLFRRDLSKRLDKLAQGKRGFKTMFMNKAIETLLDEMEK